MRRLQRFRRPQRFMTSPAQAVIDPVPRDAIQPRPQAILFPQMAQMPPGRNECFLGQILALAQIPRRAVSQRTNHRLVARHNLSKSVPIPGEAQRHQFGIFWNLIKHAGSHHNTIRVVKSRPEVTNFLEIPFRPQS